MNRARVNYHMQIRFDILKFPLIFIETFQIDVDSTLLTSMSRVR